MSDKKKILIVDDESAVRRLTVRMLGALDYDILDAECGAAGLEILHQNEGPEIVLVMTDFNMPNMSGVEMVQKMLETHPDLKIIYVSGFDKDTITNDSNGTCPDDIFLQKPFTRDQITQTIESALQATSH